MTGTMIFKKPERKLDSFLVPIRDKKHNKIRIRFTDDIILQKIFKVQDQDAHVIQCLINDENILAIMKEYDQQVLEHVLENCNLWFGTNLSKQKIQDMFLSSIHDQQTIRCLVSSVIEPIVMLDNQVLHSFHELLPVVEQRKTLSNLRVLLEIEAQGIYIRSRKFGIRWMVKTIHIHQDDLLPLENLVDASVRMDICKSYENDVEEIETMITAEIHELHKKIKTLEKYTERIKNMVTQIYFIGNQEDKESEKEWAEKTENLSKMIWEYQRTRCSEK